MSAFTSNPFVLPGLGQSGEAASNPLLASMQMMREAFAGLSGPGGLAAGLQMTRAMDPEELEKKIADLRTVENWLKLNLSMLSSTIQGMEVQLATIVTLRSYVSSVSGGDGKSAGASASPLEQVLGLHPGGKTSPAPSWPMPEQAAPKSEPLASGVGAASPTPASQTAAGGEAADATAADVSANHTNAAPTGTEALKQAADAVPAAAQAWWNMLQQQFGQVAQATAASMASGVAAASPNRAQPAPSTTRAQTKKNTAPRSPKPRTKPAVKASGVAKSPVKTAARKKRSTP
jgi:hypothetical protein